MVLVRTAEIEASYRRPRLLAFALLFVPALIACDPTFAINLRNDAAETIVVGRMLVTGGNGRWDAVEVEPGATAMVARNGAASMARLDRIVVFAEGCRVLADELLTEGFLEGGTIVVGADLDVQFVSGGNPPAGADPVPSAACESEIDALD